MVQRNFGGVYANMEFKPYEWQEYPKHIPTGPWGQYQVANNEAEETAILAKLQHTDDNAPPEPAHYVPDPEKEILISRAAELGVAINRKWSKAKIQHLVEEAESDVDALPIEVEASEEEHTEVLKEELIAEAKTLGIPANKLWGIPRLKSTIAEKKSKAKS